jgi:hypothetical protein
VNANNRCSNNLGVCESPADCFDPTSGFFGNCQPAWIEINFDIQLTPRQPVAWSASNGLSGSQVPCPGGLGGGVCPRICQGGVAAGNACVNNGNCPGSTCAFASNAGTRIPPISEVPFIGELKCIQTDSLTRLPRPCNTLDCTADPANCCRADLEGQATIVESTVLGQLDPATYNAIGLRPVGFNNGDRTLVIGGTDGTEYQPCSQVLVFNHLFDGAQDPISLSAIARSELTLVPCTQDFLQQLIPQVTAQFLVYNEFEQRLSTSRSVDCLLDSQISLIDTSQPNRSIFSAGVSGTVAGQTRITGVNGGLIGSGLLQLCDPTGCDATSNPPGTAAYNLNQFADRTEADFISIP